MMLNTSANLVFLFIIFGRLFEAVGVSNFFLQSALLQEGTCGEGLLRHGYLKSRSNQPASIDLAGMISDTPKNLVLLVSIEYVHLRYGCLETMMWEGVMGKAYFGGSKLYGIKSQYMVPFSLYQFQNGKPVYLQELPIQPGILDK